MTDPLDRALADGRKYLKTLGSKLEGSEINVDDIDAGAADNSSQMQAFIAGFEDFINEPPRSYDIEPMEVRDYRHSLYRIWSPLRDAILALAPVERVGEKRCGDAGADLCAACSLPAHELTQEPGCGGPLPLSIPVAHGDEVEDNPKQQDRSRAAVDTLSADNSEVEPDDRQEQRNRNPDRQSGEDRQVGGRAALHAGGMQRSERHVRPENGADVTGAARDDQPRAALSSELRDTLDAAFEIADAAPELNMCNYDHDDVDSLNKAMIEVHQLLATLTKGARDAG